MISYLTEKCRGCKISFVGPPQPPNTTPIYAAETLLDLWPPQAVIKFKNKPDEKDDFSPLQLILCKNCKLVQLAHYIEKDRMFRDYHYVSGMNASMRASLLDVVKHAETLVDLQPGDSVVDIGSNDDTTLNFYRSYVNKIGFDPALNISTSGNTYHIPDYFNLEDAKILLGRISNGKAKIVTALAMFYDLEDPNKFCADVKEILHEDGVFIIQMNYLGDMVERLTLDNISHEHLCYYSFTTLHRILKNNGFDVDNVSFNDVNGGSMRVVARHRPNVLTWQTTEARETRLSDVSTYVDFARRLEEIKQQIQTYVRKELDQGKSVWAAAASTRGNTLLQWLGFDSKIITKISDRNPLKVGKFTAGGNIPICSEEEMRATQPDNLLLLAYHFSKEIIQREKEYLRRGGKIILPLPTFRIMTG